MATAKADATKSGDTIVVDTDVTTRAGSIDADAVVQLSVVRKPFYAYVGAADLAVEKLRALPNAYVDALRSAQEQAKERQDAVRAIPTQVRESLQTLPERVRSAYEELAVRGQRLVSSIRSNPDTRTAVDEAKAAVSEVKDAATHARRSAKAGEKAAEDTGNQVG